MNFGYIFETIISCHNQNDIYFVKVVWLQISWIFKDDMYKNIFSGTLTRELIRICESCMDHCSRRKDRWLGLFNPWSLMAFHYMYFQEKKETLDVEKYFINRTWEKKNIFLRIRHIFYFLIAYYSNLPSLFY